MKGERLITKKRTLFGLSVAGIALAAVFVVALKIGFSDSSSASDPVRVFDGSGESLEFESFQEAQSHVSSKTGLAVPDVSAVPAGFRVTEIGYSAPPPAPAPSLNRVTYKVRRGSSGFTLLYVARSFDFPDKDSDHIIAQPADDVTLYKSTRQGLSEYTLLTKVDGWVATVEDSLGVDQAAVERMLVASAKH